MELKQVFSSTESLDEILSSQEMDLICGGLGAEIGSCGRGRKCTNGSSCENGGKCSKGGTSISEEEVEAW